MENAVILFYSTNYAMWASELLKEENIDNKIVSVPRMFSSDCGYCVSIAFENKEQVENILKKNEIEYDRIEKI